MSDVTIPSKKNSWLLPLATLAVLASYFAVFGRFFPNPSGRLGHDYSYFLPILLDGFFWYHLNGFWEIPWFTPSFCGGSLNYANLQSCFYTLPQILTFVTDPVAAVRLTFAVFSGLGFLGFYLLLRRAFSVSQAASLLGAALFLFNGFYVHRMIIGHFGLHAFMLLPFVMLALLGPLPPEGKTRLRRLLSDSLAAGLLIACMVQSGLGPHLIPVLLTILLVALIKGLLQGGERDFWLRWTGAGVAGVLLCLSKLTAATYLLGSFHRSTYKLPGATDFVSSTWLMLKSLFISPALDGDRMGMITNAQWALARHEWEYSITVVPVLIILYSLGRASRDGRLKRPDLTRNWRKWLQLGAIAVLLALPIAVNTYSPGWNALLKQLPLIKSASSLFRWFTVYIPFVIIAAVIVLEKAVVSTRQRGWVVGISLAAVVGANITMERDYYLTQDYNPEEIVASYHRVKDGHWVPGIHLIGTGTNQAGRVRTQLERNHLLTQGTSQIFCYEAMFGYHLEDLPLKSLHPGPVMAEAAGVLNIKNPACYVWPEANSCLPGDHFTLEQRNEAEAFAGYGPYSFQVPPAQKAANWVNALALIAALAYYILRAARGVYAYAGRRRTSSSRLP